LGPFPFQQTCLEMLVSWLMNFPNDMDKRLAK
jgi:hypothetical protein